LTSLSSFLNQAGRLQMTNAVFSSLPTFFMCTLALPKTVITQIDKYRKHCLWRGSDINAKTPPKVAWKFCKPKIEGGLGIIDIEEQKKLCFSRTSISFSTGMTLLGFIWFGKSTTEMGSSLLTLKRVPFGGKISWSYCQTSKILLSLRWKMEKVSSSGMINGPTKCWLLKLQRFFPLQKIRWFLSERPLIMMTLQTYSSFLFLRLLFSKCKAFTSWLKTGLSLIVTIIGVTFEGASTKVYKLLLGHQEVHPVLKWLWSCQPKQRVFFWLLINDRLSTRNILRRKHMHLDAYDCAHLCSLYQPGRRNSNPSFCGLSFCKDVLGLHSYWHSLEQYLSRAGFSSDRPVELSILYGNHNSPLLGHLVSKEWTHFQRHQAKFGRNQAGLFQRAQASSV